MKGNFYFRVTEKVDKKWAKSLQQIQTLFPDIPKQRIESVLELVEGDVEATIVQLLNTPETQYPVSTPLPLIEAPTPTPIPTPTPAPKQEESNFFVHNPLYSVVAGGANVNSNSESDMEPEDEKLYEELSMQINKIFAGIL